MHKMNLPEEQIAQILANRENCCNQCTSPVPLLCWRYKLKFSLQLGRLHEPDAPPDVEDSASKAMKQKKVEFAQFHILDEWRDTLCDFLDEESGSYSTTDKPWLRAFYEYEIY